MRAAAGALALLVLVAGCSTASDDDTAPKAALNIFPVDGARDLPPELPITVAAAGGTLKSVTVEAAGRPVAGFYSADRTRWHSERPMAPGVSYRVHAAVSGPGGTAVERTSKFSTLSAKKSFGLEKLLPSKEATGLTVGVGMPIMLTFDQSITDRVSIERNLVVQASKPVEGAWHWLDDKRVVFRPKEFWPPYTKVRLVARLAGVRGADGMYGRQDYVRDFQIGRSQITEVNTKTFRLTVRRDGKLIKDFPTSAGRGGVMRHYTANGIHLAMSREPVTVMVSPDAGPGQAGYYRTTTYSNVRISDSGEYVHGAPWSVGDQGRANVSHGCVNLSPANAKWFMENTLLGDPIIVTGSPRPLDPTNGWSYWESPWQQWLKVSRLRADVTASL